MSFVTQEDVFATIEPVMSGVFEEFAAGRVVDGAPFVRIPYDTALLEFGSDKPDLRNPLRVVDVTAQFAGGGFGLFAKIAAGGGVVRAVRAPGAAARPRGFYDKLNEWARDEGAGGLGVHKIRGGWIDGADCEEFGAEPVRGCAGCLRGGGWGFSVLCGGKAGGGAEILRAGADTAGNGIGADRDRRFPVLLDYRFSDV